MGAGERRFASMEPQLEGCGKGARPRTNLTGGALQWSRNLRVAERRVAYLARTAQARFNGAAT